MWEKFFTNFCLGLLCLPIPLGIVWVLLYVYRKSLGLPDWLAGILAQGIISGHKIEQDRADDEDYIFIIVATMVLVAIFACLWTYLAP